MAHGVYHLEVTKPDGSTEDVNLTGLLKYRKGRGTKRLGNGGAHGERYEHDLCRSSEIK